MDSYHGKLFVVAGVILFNSFKEYVRGRLIWKNKAQLGGVSAMGTGKAIYTTLGVIAIVISLATAVTGGLMVMDASKIAQGIVPPNYGNTTFNYDPTPPGKLNVSFPVTINYDGSFYTFADLNLTVAIYANSEGIGTPLLVNTTLLTLSPHSTFSITYALIKTSLPPVTHLSIRVFARGVMSLGGLSFIGFGLDMLYTVF